MNDWRWDFFLGTACLVSAIWGTGSGLHWFLAGSLLSFGVVDLGEWLQERRANR